MKSKGLGDTVEKITKATGIKKVVELLFDDCGCEERKEKLNKLFSYKTECLNEEEYNYLKTYDFNKQTVDTNDQRILINIYNRVFNQKQQPTSCSSCWINIIRKIKTLYAEYK